MVNPMFPLAWAMVLRFMVKHYSGCFHKSVPFYWVLSKVDLYHVNQQHRSFGVLSKTSLLLGFCSCLKCSTK